jgi:hypothetical protein
MNHFLLDQKTSRRDVTLLNIQGLDEWQDSQNEHNRQVRLLLDFFAEHLKTFQSVAVIRLCHVVDPN